MDRFSSFASGATSLSAAKWSAATTATENHIHCWVVAATFLTPPLDFYQINHTEPSLRHHGSISIAWLGYDAANSGEMSRRRRLGSGKNFIFIFLNSTLGDDMKRSVRFWDHVPPKSGRWVSICSVLRRERTLPYLFSPVFFRALSINVT